jgi:hypothetical protein
LGSNAYLGMVAGYGAIRQHHVVVWGCAELDAWQGDPGPQASLGARLYFKRDAFKSDAAAAR